MEPIESIREKLAEPKGSAAFENWYENPAAQPQRYLEAVRCFEKSVWHRPQGGTVLLPRPL